MFNVFIQVSLQHHFLNSQGSPKKIIIEKKDLIKTQSADQSFYFLSGHFAKMKIE